MDAFLSRKVSLRRDPCEIESIDVEENRRQRGRQLLRVGKPSRDQFCHRLLKPPAKCILKLTGQTCTIGKG